MNREYHTWFSTVLQRDMELLVFGHSGRSVLFFPTRTARFYDYENWKVLESLQPQLESGHLQVYCVDSIDQESFYCSWCQPSGRIQRHLLYEQYILNEVLPFMDDKNPGSFLIAAGCSMGAYHAVNISLKHPGLFKKVVGISGRYDLTQAVGNFKDLFDGYRDEPIYFNTPNQFIPNLNDPIQVQALKNTEILFAIGQHDVFLDNNKHLSANLLQKGINNSLFIWDGEAHKPWYWKKMVELYF